MVMRSTLLWRLANLSIVVVGLVAGMWFLPRGWHTLITPDEMPIAGYPVSYLMAGCFMAFLDERYKDFAIPYFLLWFGLCNLLTFPTELLVHGFAAVSSMTIIQGYLVFVGLGILKLRGRTFMPKPTKELLLLAVALLFAELSDSYHLWSAVLMFYLLTAAAPSNHPNLQGHEAEEENPSRSASAEPPTPES